MGKKKASKPVTMDQSKVRLMQLEVSLRKQNFDWAADCLHEFNTQKVTTLDAAFGLQNSVGRPSSREVLDRDMEIIERWDRGESWATIEKEMALSDLRDARQLVNSLSELTKATKNGEEETLPNRDKQRQDLLNSFVGAARSTLAANGQRKSEIKSKTSQNRAAMRKRAIAAFGSVVGKLLAEDPAE
jgi:hypothetical protein